MPSSSGSSSSSCNIVLESPANNAEFHMAMGNATTGPTMPTVTLTAGANPCPGESDIQFRFIVGNNNRALEYEDAPLTGYAHPTPRDSGWLPQGTRSWDIVWGGFYGGHITHVEIQVRRTNGQVICTKKIARNIWILGGAIYQCSGTPRIGDYIATIAGISAVHQTMLKAIAKVETDTTHYSANATPDTTHARYPLRSADKGYGAFQLTSATYLNISSIWNWKASADMAYQAVKDKENDAKNYLNQHPGSWNAQQLKMETYCRYNGGPYHVWQNNAWIRNPDVVCGCDNSPRKGRLQSDPQSPCRVRGVCYADYTVTQEYTCPGSSQSSG